MDIGPATRREGTTRDRRPAGRPGAATTLLLTLAAMLAAALTGCSSGPKTDAPPPDAQYSFWPPLPNEPRVQFLTSYRFSSDIEPKRTAFDRIVFGKDQKVLPIGKPYGLAFWKGRIYVCDVTDPGVVILDLVARQTRVMVARSTDPMVQPIDIAVAEDGMKYVVDRRRARIFVFDADDRYVASFGFQGFTPVGIAVRGEELFVPDFEAQQVLVMDRRRGEVIRRIGAPGGEPGQFIRPLGVEVDDAGAIYVTDPIRGRFQKFDAGGQLVYSQGEIADSAGNFVRPKHVAVDRDGIVYVVDAAFQNVQMFTADAELLMFFGSPGNHGGAMNLPAGVAVTDEGLELFEAYLHPAFQAERLVLVTNQFGLQKVSVYALGRLKDGRTVADIAPYAADITSGLADEQEISDALEPGEQPEQKEADPADSPRQEE